MRKQHTKKKHVNKSCTVSRFSRVEEVRTRSEVAIRGHKSLVNYLDVDLFRREIRLYFDGIVGVLECHYSVTNYYKIKRRTKYKQE